MTDYMFNQKKASAKQYTSDATLTLSLVIMLTLGKSRGKLTRKELKMQSKKYFSLKKLGMKLFRNNFFDTFKNIDTFQLTCC